MNFKSVTLGLVLSGIDVKDIKLNRYKIEGFYINKLKFKFPNRDKFINVLVKPKELIYLHKYKNYKISGCFRQNSYFKVRITPYLKGPIKKKRDTKFKNILDFFE